MFHDIELEKTLEGKSGVYMWTSPSGRCYIGQSVDLGRRHKEFRTDSKYAGQGSIIDAARQKYSYSMWEYKVLEYCSKDKLDEREKYYIEKYHPQYNITKGGIGGCGIPKSAFKRGRKRTEAELAKCRETRKKHIEEGVIDFKDRSQPIAFYTLDGVFFKMFDSHREAGKYFGKNRLFGEMIKNNYVFQKKYMVRAVDKNGPDMFIEPYEKKKQVYTEEHLKKLSEARKGKETPWSWKAVTATNVKNGEVITFQSIREAAANVNPENIKGGQKNITAALHGKRPRAYGFTWKFAS